MVEPSRAEHMWKAADVAEGRHGSLDIGEGLRAHLGAEGQVDWRAKQEAQQQAEEELVGLDLELHVLRQGFPPGPGRRAVQALENVLRIARQVAQAYPDAPGVVRAMADMEAEIARVVG